MTDTIESITLNNVEIQANGLIRSSNGSLIGKLSSDVSFQCAKTLVVEQDKTLLSDFAEQVINYFMQNGSVITKKDYDYVLEVLKLCAEK